MTLANGKYIWNMQAVKEVVRWAPVDTRPLTSLYLTMEGRLLKGPGTARYGLVFRMDNRAGNYYYLTIDDNQRLVFALRNAGTWNYLIDHSGVRAIRPGTMNRLGVSAVGSHFQMFVNDQFVGAWDDATLTTGGVGLVMELQAGESAAVEFDNFELRAPP